MSRPFRTPVLAAVAALSLAACTDDPFERPGTVAPRGFNDANLRAMVVDPAHLRRGLEANATRGDAGAKPVDQLRSGKRAPLAGNVTARAGVTLSDGGSANGSH